MWAAMRSQSGIARRLIDAGANVRAQRDGATVLHLAALVGDLATVQLLVERGADVAALNPQGGSPLRSAADGGHVEVVRYLLERGARRDVRDAFGLLPIDYARQNGHAQVVALLSSGT